MYSLVIPSNHVVSEFTGWAFVSGFIDVEPTLVYDCSAQSSSTGHSERILDLLHFNAIMIV